jgi:hypothetical protein
LGADKLFSISYVVSNLQVMNGSQRPIVQGIRRIASKSAFWASSLYDRRQLDPDEDMEMFEKELELIRQHGDVELPPSTVKCLKHTNLTDFLHCDGFTLTNR